MRAERQVGYHRRGICRGSACVGQARSGMSRAWAWQGHSSRDRCRSMRELSLARDRGSLVCAETRGSCLAFRRCWAFSEPQLRRSRAAPLSPKRISSFRPSDEELAHETLTTVTVVGSEESRTLLSPRIAPDGRKKNFRRERNGGHKSVASRAPTR